MTTATRSTKIAAAIATLREVRDDAEPVIADLLASMFRTEQDRVRIENFDALEDTITALEQLVGEGKL